MKDDIIIHRENNITFCMTNESEPEYKVLVDEEVCYAHWDFDIAVREYEIVRKEMSQK